jgi:hypothetical protein
VKLGPLLIAARRGGRAACGAQGRLRRDRRRPGKFADGAQELAAERLPVARARGSDVNRTGFVKNHSSFARLATEALALLEVRGGFHGSVAIAVGHRRRSLMSSMRHRGRAAYPRCRVVGARSKAHRGGATRRLLRNPHGHLFKNSCWLIAAKVYP